MKMKFSWEFLLWVLFITVGALIETDVFPAGLALKLATAAMMVLKTVTTFLGSPVIEKKQPGGDA